MCICVSVCSSLCYLKAMKPFSVLFGKFSCFYSLLLLGPTLNEFLYLGMKKGTISQHNAIELEKIFSSTERQTTVVNLITLCSRRLLV